MKFLQFKNNSSCIYSDKYIFFTDYMLDFLSMHTHELDSHRTRVIYSAEMRRSWMANFAPLWDIKDIRYV